jgi:DNA-binding CsgD family transcriptional regulator
MGRRSKKHITPIWPPREVDIGQLTHRQIDVLKLVPKHSNKEIAEILSLTTSTVKSHITKLLQIFGVPTRTQLAVEWTKLDVGRRGTETGDQDVGMRDLA